MRSWVHGAWIFVVWVFFCFLIFGLLCLFTAGGLIGETAKPITGNTISYDIMGSSAYFGYTTHIQEYLIQSDMQNAGAEVRR